MNADRLKAAMREEAMEGVPEFSPLLHERIMSGLRSSEAKRDAVAGRAWWVWGRYAAAAAVVIVGASLAWSIYGSRRVTTVVQVPSPQDISEPVDRILTSAAAPAVQSMDEARYGYLDHDAKNFVTFLASQIPGAPMPDSPHHTSMQNNAWQNNP